MEGNSVLKHLVRQGDWSDRLEEWTSQIKDWTLEPFLCHRCIFFVDIRMSVKK
jgi:hypothetical protein